MALIEAYAYFYKILYFRSKLERVVLNNEMGYSIPYFYFYNKPPVIVFSDANVKTRNSFEKSRLINPKS